MIAFEITIHNPDKLTEGFVLSINTHDVSINFNSFNLRDGKIWISRLDGEGGQFSTADLYRVIEKFYNNNF